MSEELSGFLEEFGEQLKAAMADADRAPSVPCPACGKSMMREIGFGKLTAYLCWNHDCVGVKVTIEELCDADNWKAIQHDAQLRFQARLDMKKRNGAHRDHAAFDNDLTRLGEEFASARHMTRAKLQKALIDQSSQIAHEWRAYLSERRDFYCGDCNGYHKPTLEHPLCSLCRMFVHAAASADIHFDYKGWRFFPPFVCMGCGIEVCFRQWAFSRSCGACDVSKSRIRRLLSGKCFAGRHELIDEHDPYFISADHFVDPSQRDKYPVLFRPPFRQRLSPKPLRPGPNPLKPRRHPFR